MRYLVVLLLFASCKDNFHRKVVDSFEFRSTLAFDSSSYLILDIPKETPDDFNFIDHTNVPYRAQLNGCILGSGIHSSYVDDRDNCSAYCYSYIMDSTFRLGSFGTTLGNILIMEEKKWVGVRERKFKIWSKSMRHIYFFNIKSKPVFNQGVLISVF